MDANFSIWEMHYSGLVGVPDVEVNAGGVGSEVEGVEGF